MGSPARPDLGNQCSNDDIMTFLRGMKKEFDERLINLESLNSRIVKVEEETKANSEEIKNMKTSNETMKSEVSEMKIENEILRQSQFKNSVEISGIPLKNKENTSEIISNVFAHLKTGITTEEISTCYRVGRRNRTSVNGEIVYPSIMIEFLREDTKQLLLEKSKKHPKAISTVELGFTESAASIVYINERLTPYFKRILLLARKEKKAGKLKYVWVKGGAVYGRMDDESPIMKFNHTDDIFSALNDEDDNETNPDGDDPNTRKKSTENHGTNIGQRSGIRGPRNNKGKKRDRSKPEEEVELKKSMRIASKKPKGTSTNNQ